MLRCVLVVITCTCNIVPSCGIGCVSWEAGLGGWGNKREGVGGGLEEWERGKAKGEGGRGKGKGEMEKGGGWWVVGGSEYRVLWRREKKKKNCVHATDWAALASWLAGVVVELDWGK